MIPVAENKQAREIMNAKVDTSNEAVELFKVEANDSYQQQELKRIDLKEIREEIIAEVESWGVKKEEKMTARYYFTVWLIPLILVGIALR